MDNHHLWYRFVPKKELTQVYASVALRYFALSLISLFVPLYLYKEIGYTFVQTLGFYMFYSVIFAIFSPIAAKLCSRYGVKHVVLFSVPFYIVFISLLYVLPYYKINLMILATFVGIYLAFYWMGLHLIFHKASHKKHRGEEVGKRMAVSILATISGPLIGGVIITYFGFKLLFGMTALILVASSLVLFLSKENHTLYHFSFRSVIDAKHWKNSLFFVSQGTRVMADSVIWPLFIFFILGDYLSLGILGSLIAAFSGITVFLSGKYSDHTSKRKIAWWATGFDSLAWFVKSIVFTTTQIFAVTIFGAFTNGIKEAPLAALEYDKAEGDVSGYFVSREIFICLGRILLLLLVLLTNSLSGGLFFQGFANLATLLF